IVALPDGELVPVRILRVGEPAHARDGHLVLGLTAELADPVELRVDVVGLEVDPDPAILARIDRAAGLALEHVVLGRALLSLGVVLERPAGELAPELRRLLGAARRDLDVDDLALHLPPPLMGLQKLPNGSFTRPGHEAGCRRRT